MRRRAFLATATLLVPGLAGAQSRTPILGLLWNDSVKPSPYVAVLLTALGEKGYTVGRNLRIEDRVGLDGYSGYETAVAELLKAKVDMIVASGATATVTAAKATKEIPIVTVIGSDPVGLGLAKSLSHPGGNVTGVATRTVGLTAKRMGLLKDLVPGVSRVGVLLAANVANPKNRTESEAAAKALNVQLRFADVHTADDIEPRIDELVKSGVGAINVSAGTLLSVNAGRVVGAIAKARIPAIYSNERYADAGGLVSYAGSMRKAFVQLAGYIDRVLKGARPGDLAIEQREDFELVVNMRTAKLLGLKVPQTILVRADRVIE